MMMDSSAPTAPPKRPREVLVNDDIHAHHRDLEKRFMEQQTMWRPQEEDLVASGEGTDGSGVIGAWRAVWTSVEGSRASRRYAMTMDRLFSGCAESTTLVVDMLQRYFRAASCADGHARGVCGRGAAELKRRRKSFFVQNGRSMTQEEVHAESLQVEAECAIRGRPIVILDVGSCHGALESLVERDPSLSALYRVASLDLCPSQPHVYQADWLALDVLLSEGHEANVKGTLFDSCLRHKAVMLKDAENAFTAPQDSVGNVARVCGSAEADTTAPQRSNHWCQQIVGIKDASVDVVLMCYMLSFLPDGRLRWHACKRAASVLSKGGLFIIMEPRRGVRQNAWGKRWSTILFQSFGFVLHRKECLDKTVVLQFTKPLSPPVEPLPSSSQEETSMDFW